MNTLMGRDSIDPRASGGKPCLKGTSIWVSLILDFLAEGVSEAEMDVVPKPVRKRQLQEQIDKERVLAF